jgi:hypothetical protein
MIDATTGISIGLGILFVIFIIFKIIDVMYIKKKEDKKEGMEGKKQEEEIDNGKSEPVGWWQNIIDCKKNGNNDLYCKPKNQWVFPY